MDTEVLPTDHPAALPHAADVLEHGGLVAFPTDTVYGLAALPFDEESVRRLYVVKGRRHSKAIAVLFSRLEELEQLAATTIPEVTRLAEAFWPGPLTLIVPKHPELPEVLSPLPTLGVRIPDHAVALALLRRTGPLAVTSANRSGQKNALTAQDVFDQLEGRVHLILDGGRTPGGVPSTVIDLSDSQISILREGPIGEETIRAALNASRA